MSSNNINIQDIPRGMMIDILQNIINDIKHDTNYVESYSIKFVKHYDDII